MTDNEIIKALECCGSNGWGKEDVRPCDKCPMQECEDCEVELPDYVLDLINRQKAKIERLKRYDEERDIALHARLIANAKTEAIREFAENVKTAINERFSDEIQDSNSHLYLMNTLLDDLVREMTEESNDQQKT